jgi:hypothetical protein
MPRINKLLSVIEKIFSMFFAIKYKLQINSITEELITSFEDDFNKNVMNVEIDDSEVRQRISSRRSHITGLLVGFSEELKSKCRKAINAVGEGMKRFSKIKKKPKPKRLKQLKTPLRLSWLT